MTRNWGLILTNFYFDIWQDMLSMIYFYEGSSSCLTVRHLHIVGGVHKWLLLHHCPTVLILLLMPS